jgi:hypothetical protein
LLQVSDDYVRDVIAAFNERGFDALDPKPSGDTTARSVGSSGPGSPAIARTSPADWGRQAVKQNVPASAADG